MNFLARQKKLRGQLASAGLDALLVSHLPNIRYLCGFTGSAGFLLVTETGSVFFTDVRYETQARDEVKGAKVMIARKAVVNALGEWIGGRGKRTKGWTVGIEAEHMTVAERKRLADLLPSGLRLRNAPALVERARMVKDDDELGLIRAAVQLGATLVRPGARSIAPGSERIRGGGGDGVRGAPGGSGGDVVSYDHRFGSAVGAASWSGHGAGHRAGRIRGLRFRCYTRWLLFGPDPYCVGGRRFRCKGIRAPEKDARRAYEAVREAQEAAIAAVRPGVSVGEVDAAARKVLRKAGLGRYFTHSTGHGVGLEIHEAPRVAAGQKEVLRPGMVITIEPGVYFPGKWGVRIEDMVAVTEGGCEVLTPTSKDFLAI